MSGHHNLLIGGDFNQTVYIQLPISTTHFDKFLRKTVDSCAEDLKNRVPQGVHDALDNRDDYLDDIIDTYLETYDFLLISGNSGAGKTISGLWLFQYFAEKIINGECTAFTPILIPLRDYEFNENSSSLLKQFFLRNTIPETEYIALRERGLLLIVDGLDEVPDVGVAQNILKALKDVSVLSRYASKFIITTRTQFFKNAIEEASAEKWLIRNKHNARFLNLLDFGDDSIKLYLKKVFGDDQYESIFETIRNTYDLLGLSRTPLLLEMVSSTIIGPEKPNVRIDNKADLYSTYIDQWLENEKFRFLTTNNTLTFPRENILLFLEDVAFDLYFKKQYKIKYDDLYSEKYELYFNKYENAEPFFEKMIRTNTIFRRSGDYYEFQHASFMEYLAALKTSKELKECNIEILSGKQFIYEIMEFLKYIVDETYMSSFETIMDQTDCPELKQAVVEIIGTSKMASFSDLLKRVASTEENSLIATEALISLGYLGEKSYINKYVTDMRNDSALDEENAQFVLQYYGGEEKARELLHTRLKDPYYDNVKAFHLHCVSKIANLETLKIINIFKDHPDEYVKEYAKELSCKLPYSLNDNIRS